MLLRPASIVLQGELIFGKEVEILGGKIVRIGPHSGMPDDFVLSPAFVNAHSHLEYRGLLNHPDLKGLDYFSWIRELTRLKGEQNLADVERDCEIAAKENRRTGVALIGEHSDRPFSGAALERAEIGGTIFQEVITFLEQQHPAEKLASVCEKATLQQGVFSGKVVPSPHSAQLVDSHTLRTLSGGPVSIHVAETPHEKALFRDGAGPFAELYEKFGFESRRCGMGVVDFLDSVGLLRAGNQFVHGCDLSDADLAKIARAGVSLVHCPRSNQALKCPKAQVRAWLDHGICVGLGLDSAASSGPIDMFAEMREALQTSHETGHHVQPGEVWQMATTWGAKSLGVDSWAIEAGSECPMIKINLSGCVTVEDIIERGKPENVEWVEK